MPQPRFASYIYRDTLVVLNTTQRKENIRATLAGSTLLAICVTDETLTEKVIDIMTALLSTNLLRLINVYDLNICGIGVLCYRRLGTVTMICNKLPTMLVYEIR
jgi:hypothetical protein